MAAAHMYDDNEENHAFKARYPEVEIDDMIVDDGIPTFIPALMFKFVGKRLQ